MARALTPDDPRFALLSLYAKTGRFDGLAVDRAWLRTLLAYPELDAVNTIGPSHEVGLTARVDIANALLRRTANVRIANDVDMDVVTRLFDPQNTDPVPIVNALRESGGDPDAFLRTPAAEELVKRGLLSPLALRDICDIRDVTVGGCEAVWIYSAFTTSRSFDDLQPWLDPLNWTALGPLLFRSVSAYTTRTTDQRGGYDRRRCTGGRDCR